MIGQISRTLALAALAGAVGLGAAAQTGEPAPLTETDRPTVDTGGPAGTEDRLRSADEAAAEADRLLRETDPVEEPIDTPDLPSLDPSTPAEIEREIDEAVREADDAETDIRGTVAGETELEREAVGDPVDPLGPGPGEPGALPD